MTSNLPQHEAIQVYRYLLSQILFYSFQDGTYLVVVRNRCHVAGLAVELVDAGKVSGRRS